MTANDRLYEYGKDGQIADSKEVNQGYTRLLETVMRIKEDGAGAVREVPGYQYEKFFDAMAVANRDKWQQALRNVQSLTHTAGRCSRYIL